MQTMFADTRNRNWENGIVSAWRGIEEFLAVGSKGSFTAAAQALGVSKSYISKTVNELEARLGTQLVLRNSRRLSLTPAGEIFYKRCAAMQDNLVELEQEIVLFQSEPVGSLRIGLSDTFGSDFMSSLVAKFSQMHPDIVIEAIAYLRESELVQEEFDIVIRYGKLPDSDLRARLFGYLSYCLCASPAYVEEHGWPTSVEDLVNHRCLTDTSGTYSFNGDKRARLKGRWISNSGVALRWAAREGLGLAHLPVSVVRQDLVDGHLIALDADWSYYDKEVWAVFSHNIMPASIRMFIDFLIARFTKEKIRPWMAGRISPENDVAIVHT